MAKAINWIGGIFLGFGLLFASIGAWIYASDLDLVLGGERTDGKVLRLERSYGSNGSTYRPVVAFTDADGAQYEFVSTVGSKPAAFSRGEQVEVIYDPSSPDKAIIDSFTTLYLLPLAFLGFGVVFGGIGGGMLYYRWRRKRIIARLQSNGLPIPADLLECFHDTGTKVNGRSPWRVVVQATHPATGKLTSFKSEPVWVDPSDALAGQKLRVLVDPANPRHYFVDLNEFIDEEDIG